MSKNSSLVGFIHPELKHQFKRECDTRASCDMIDAAYDRRYSRTSCIQERAVRKHMPTAHEIAERNPILRALLRDMQR